MDWQPSRSATKHCQDALPFTLRELKNKTVVDAGCGDSGDADLVAENGGTGIGYDLFPRRESYDFPKTIRAAFKHTRKSQFKIQDICERWPNEKKSVDIIISNAVLDLLSVEEREMFYRECFRVLKDNGLLSIRFQRLKNGHGFDLYAEKAKLKSLGFTVWNFYGCLMARPEFKL